MAINQPMAAVVGCGYWGKNLVRNMAELGALAAVSDVDSDRSAQMAAQFETKSLTLSELWQSDIPAVAIAAPAALHYELACKALTSGKHVFVEKPLALSVAAGEHLCQLAGKHSRVLMVGHLLQYHPSFLALKNLVSQG